MAPRKCSVKSCCTNPGVVVHYHGLPSDPTVKKAWIKWLEETNCEPFIRKNALICSKHFSLNDRWGRRLRPGSVPCQMELTAPVTEELSTPITVQDNETETAVFDPNEMVHTDSTSTTRNAVVPQAVPLLFDDERNVTTRSNAVNDNMFEMSVNDAVASQMYSSVLQIDVGDYRSRHPRDVFEVYLQTDITEMEFVYSSVVEINVGIPIEGNITANEIDNVNEVQHGADTFDCNKSVGNVESVGVIHHILDEENDYNVEPLENELCVEPLQNELPVEVVQNEQKWNKKCCFYGCMNNNLDNSMFSFPNVVRSIYGQKRVNVGELNRFLKWVEVSGNSQLLLIDPVSIRKKYFVCGAHFEKSCFSSPRRLKCNALPTLHFHGFDEHSLISVYKSNVNTWKDDMDNETIFISDSSIAMCFEEDMKCLSWSICPKCKEKRMVDSRTSSYCSHRSKCWQYSSSNNMDPGDVPEELKGLTYIEEQLIARVHPLISIFKLKGLQFGYRGHVVNFEQDVNEFVKQLPHRVQDLNSVLSITYAGTNMDKYHEFFVRAEKVRNALLFLKENNPYYADIEISEDNIALLPENGSVSKDIASIEMPGDMCDSSPEDMEDLSDASGDHIHKSFVPNGNNAFQNDQIKSKLNWPPMKEKVDEFRRKGYIVCAFPCLFPRGIADYYDIRPKEVKASNYFKHLLFYHDDRFAQHATFRYFALNTWMRWSALNDGNVFVKNNDEFKNLTAGQLRDMIEEDPNVIKKIMYQASNLRGTKPYWHSKAGELKDLVEQIGLPTVFLTLSCADGHWTDLFRLLTNNDDVSNLSEYDRRKLIQENPQTVSMFFNARVESFVEKVLKVKYHVKDYWYRVEYQHRGSPHIHGVFWFEGAPDMKNIENATEEEVAKAIDYFSELVTAVIPNANVPLPDVHPCRTSYQDIKNIEEDLSQLLLKVQRHSKCNSGYCLRVNKKTKLKECRFGFPRDLHGKATIEKKPCGEMEFKPERNDPLLNKFNAFISLLWRANIDIAPVVSEKALLSYLTKYISKCEVQSQSLNEILGNIMQKVDENSKAKSVIQRLFTNACVERDISAQEVCHTLLSLPMVSAGGRQFVIVNTNEKKWAMVSDIDNDTQMEKGGKSFIEKYRERPENMENVSLWDAAKYYNVRGSSWSLIKGKEHIVRIFPRYSNVRNDVEASERYYQQQVLLHQPWRYAETLKTGFDSWKDVYDNYNISEKSCVMYKLGNEIENEDDEFESDTDDESDSNYDEEFMIISRLGPNSSVPPIELGNREVDLSYDWMQSSTLYEHLGTLEEFQSFIADAKKKNESNEMVIDIEVPDVRLSADQQNIVDIVSDIVKNLKSGTAYVPRRIIVQGKAGTGKSLIIKFITSLLQKELGNDSYFLGAPTGVSAILINGRTLHQIFKLSMDSNDFKPLTGERARELVDSFANVKFLILDEWSMIGCKALAMIEARCREATGIQQEFGGLTVIMFGDGKQLPPVKDNALCSQIQATLLGQRGRAIIKTFDTKVVLTTCHRQENKDFLNLLDNVGNGEICTADYNVLASRFSYVLSDDERKTFECVIRLFATKEEVKMYNLNALRSLRDNDTGAPIPVAKIEARHNCSAGRKASSDAAGGLSKVLYLAKGCQIMLRQNLWTSKHLVNGSIGKVHDILFKPDEEFPSVILCEFPNYTGPEFIPGTKIIPIKPTLKSFCYKNQKCTRYQFPIDLCYGMSVHKSQGMTLDKVVVDIGVSEFALGLTYVALTRVRNLCDIMISPFLPTRLMSINTNNGWAQRRDFFNWLYGN